MGEWDGKDRRWAELMDRKALGDPLSPEELALCERAAAEDPACLRELELLDELAELDAPPDAASRALVDAALARLASEREAAERAELEGVRAPSRAGRIAWIASGAAAAALVAGYWAFSTSPRERAPVAAPPPAVTAPRIELVYAAGDVRVDGEPVTFGAALLSEGSVIQVGRGAACLAMDPAIDVCASDGTRLALTRVHSPWRRLDLLEGKIGAQLAQQPEGFRLSIVAGEVWSTAIGTAFTVERGAEQTVRTTVLHGKVRVGSEGGDERVVSEHQRSEVRGGQASVAPTSRSDESPEWALLRPSKLWSNPVSATLQVRGAPDAAEVLLDGQRIGIAPLATLIPAGMHTLTVRVDGRITATREFVSEVGQVTTIAFDEQQFQAKETEPEPQARRAAARVRGPKPAPVQPAETGDDAAQAAQAGSAAELLADARRLLRAGRFEDAAARYAELRAAHPHSPEAHTVLVSLAELQLDRLDQPQEALEHLELYLRGGHGALLEEARLARIRALRRLGRTDAERDALAEFLREHPRSFKASALEQRLSELAAPH